MCPEKTQPHNSNKINGHLKDLETNILLIEKIVDQLTDLPAIALELSTINRNMLNIVHKIKQEGLNNG